MPGPKRIRYIYRGARRWMLSDEVPDDERGWSPHATETRLLCDVDVEIVLQAMRAEFPDDDVRVLNWYRPKRD